VSPRATDPDGVSRRRRPTARTPADFEAWVHSALAYVPVVARRYSGCGLPFDELLAAGNLGLVEAALRFDPSRGVKFVTYADWWIRKSVLGAIQEQTGAVRLPRYRRERLREVRDVRARLRRTLGTDPTVEQVASAGGWDVEDVRGLLGSDVAPLSLDHPVAADAGRPLRETLAAEPDDGHPHAVVDGDYRDHVRDAIAGLEARERVVLALRFGFLGEDPLTLREVGARLRLSRERVRQIERRALLRLRRFLEAG